MRNKKPTVNGDMTQAELIAHLKITPYSWYRAKLKGLVPSPEVGYGLQRKYSAAQLEQIKNNLKGTK